MENEYREFMDALVKKAGLISGEEIYHISFEENVETKDGPEDLLLIKFKNNGDKRQVCSINAEAFYKKHRKLGSTQDEAAKCLVMELEEVEQHGLMDMADVLCDYQNVEDSLYVRLLNVEDNRTAHAVSHVIGDIALVACALFGEDEDTYTSAIIREELLVYWERDKEEVLAKAIQNTMRKAPPRIYLWEKFLMNQEYQGESFLSPLDQAEEFIRRDCLGNCLSTEKRTNGAAAIFFPGVAKRLSQLVGGDLYLVFTSVHEVMVHNVNYNQPDKLKKILEETLEMATPEKDILTGNIYKFCEATGEIICVLD